tara:strand:+ start:9918 stop:10364 length:447 start_codon:yes stop_codon:yes gene_type:complete
MLITKSVEFDMGHRVPYHKSKCKNPHGHRYKVEVCLQGDIVDIEGKSENGMVMDFKDVKEILMIYVHDKLDHKFMYWKKDMVMKNFFTENHEFEYIEMPFTPTAENICEWIYKDLATRYKDVFNNNLRLYYVKLWETPTSVAISKPLF